MEVHHARKQTTAADATLPGGFVVKKQYGRRYWMVIDPLGELVCLTVQALNRCVDGLEHPSPLW